MRNCSIKFRRYFKIDAIDDDTAKELINRSKENLIKEKEAVAIKLKELGLRKI